MYPNQYCHQCNEPEPCVPLPAPPDCTGEPCEEIVLDTCVRYTGPAIPCLGITTGANLNQVLQIIAARLCDCCDGTPPVIDCVVSDWSAWSACVNGVQTRTRTVIQAPQNGGAACPDLIETRECCVPVDCVVSDWSAWSACDVDLVRTRTRTVITPASCGGAACPVLIETEACSPIPIPCPEPAFTVTPVGCNGFSVTVTHNATQPSVTMEYQAVGASSWTIGGMLTTTLAGPNVINVSGVSANTTYNVRVKTKCLDGDSNWINHTVVVPACGICTPLENITTHSDNCETAFVSFDDDGTAATLSAELFNTASPTVVISTKTWTPLGSTANYSHTFTGLPAGTYFIKVYKTSASATCDVILTSQIVVVDCPIQCPAPVNLNVTEVCDHVNNGVTASATVTGMSALTLVFDLYNVTAGGVLVNSQTASVPGGGSGSVNFFGLGLIAGDTYEVRVLTTCENFGTSSQITTTFVKAACKPAPLAPCPPPLDLSAVVS